MCRYAREKVSSTFGIRVKGGDAAIEVDFPAIMERMRRLRADIAAADSVRGLQFLFVCCAYNPLFLNPTRPEPLTLGLVQQYFSHSKFP